MDGEPSRTTSQINKSSPSPPRHVSMAAFYLGSCEYVCFPASVQTNENHLTFPCFFWFWLYVSWWFVQGHVIHRNVSSLTLCYSSKSSSFVRHSRSNKDVSGCGFDSLWIYCGAVKALWIKASPDRLTSVFTGISTQTHCNRQTRS